MPRASKMVARAARRSAMILPDLPRSRKKYKTNAPQRTCRYCSKTLDSLIGRDRHILLKPQCRARHMLARAQQANQPPKRKRTNIEDDGTGVGASAGEPASKHPRVDDTNEPLERMEGNADGERSPENGGESDAGKDEAEDRVCEEPFIEKFPISTAGEPISMETKPAPNLRAYIDSCGRLRNPELFDTAELLFTTVPKGKDRTKHLQSKLYRGNTPWRKNRALMKDIDRLPHGPEWTSHVVYIGEGEARRRHVVFKRNIIDIIRELIGNPHFKKFMCYAPQRHWTSKRRKNRVYSEMWTGNWWWRTQYLICDPSGTVVPLIVASDQTTLTQFSGGQYAYPVYLTIGNISKNIRRKPTKGASMVIGYLPVDSFRDVANLNLRARLRGELLHRSLETIFEPLKTASREGVEMWCADGRLRRVYPVLASYIGDWPEQNDIACTMRNGCPVCQQKFKGRGSGKRDAPMRSREDTLAALGQYMETNNLAQLRRHGLKPWWPFWADLPHVNISSSLTPDLLHQLHKGLFYTHLMHWMEEVMGGELMDSRFEAMPRAKDLRHFRRGVTTISQWTGRETKEMMKQALPTIIGNPKIDSASDADDFIEMARALLDFGYIAHSARLTDSELADMDAALDTFHQLKNVVVRLEVLRDESKFDWIPKLHMVGHYAHFVREFGTPDGYNSEMSEHLHIAYAKEGWRVSNRRDPIPQIIQFVTRQEALRIHRAHLNAFLGLESEDKGDDWIDTGSEGSSAADVGDSDDDSVEMRAEASDESSDIRYPRPEHGIAMRPTRERLRGTVLINDYGATDLIHALKRFLTPRARALKESFLVEPSDRFDVWHKLSLYHLPLPFAPDEPLHRDVVRVQPPVPAGPRNAARAGTFDTALFLKNPSAFGIHRYRACRVRAMFSLPARLQHLAPVVLAYVELFTPFDDPVAGTHLLHATSADVVDGRRRSLIIPVTSLMMSCHLAPNFGRLNGVRLGSHTDILDAGRHFFLNHYYNTFFYLFNTYWRRMCSGSA